MSFNSVEIRHLVIAWAVLAFAFSVSSLFRSPAQFPIIFLVSLVGVGAGFVLHELSHKFTAQNFGSEAEFRMWMWGLGLAVFMAAASGGAFIFAAPGAVYIGPAYGKRYYDQRQVLRESGIISLAGPGANVVLAMFFFILQDFGGLLGLIGVFGFRVNVFLAAFNMLPFGVLDGSKVFRWNPAIWAAVAVPIWLLWVLLFMPGLLG